MIALDARVRSLEDPAQQFEPAKQALVQELETALDEPSSAINLLERMAAENLAPSWHLDIAQRIKSITFEEWQAWQTP